MCPAVLKSALLFTLLRFDFLQYPRQKIHVYALHTGNRKEL